MANKLYIWTGFLSNWTGGLAFAVASSEADAREMIKKEYGLKIDNWGTLEVRGMSKCARCVAGGD